jgi:flagellar assembly factor FliW
MASTRMKQQQTASATKGKGRSRVNRQPPKVDDIAPLGSSDDAAGQVLVMDGTADASADTVVAQTVDVALAQDEQDAQIEIETSRFGRLVVDRERVIQLPKGLLGFPAHTQFALIQTGEENYFFWLQSVDEPQLAFVVADPAIFFKEYEVPIREETQLELELTDVSATQVFVICNKVDDWLTGNLLGPIVVNAANRRASQVVLTEKKWTTRQPLMRLAPEASTIPLAKSA